MPAPQPQQLDPAKILDADRFAEYEEQLGRSWMLERILARIDRPGLAVCDVGGARGRFLDALAARGLGEPVLVHYEALHTRPGPFYLEPSEA